MDVCCGVHAVFVHVLLFHLSHTHDVSSLRRLLSAAEHVATGLSRCTLTRSAMASTLTQHGTAVVTCTWAGEQWLGE